MMSYSLVMTPADLRVALDRLGMTQVGFAEHCGTKPRTVRRWLAGDPIPGWVGVVIRLTEQVRRLSGERVAFIPPVGSARLPGPRL